MPMDATQLGNALSTLLMLAWLLPLAGFAVEIFGGFWGTRQSKTAAYLAVFCIGAGFFLSVGALCLWGKTTEWSALEEHHAGEPAVAAATGHPPADAAHAAAGEHGAASGKTHWPRYFSGTYYLLAQFGSLRFSIDYYIDSLTLVMFTMVTLIAALIHIFAVGYMGDELTEDHEDHQVHTSHGHLHRPGRYHRFFAFFSLFSFSM